MLRSLRKHLVACVASVSVRFRSKERGTRVKDRAKNGSRLISHAIKPKIPFHGLFLLRNQTETLATQANIRRRYHWFPLQMTSQKRAQKFHTGDASLPMSG